MRSDKENPVVVLGGGIAGITAALELSRAGLEVALVEKSPFFGGRAASFGCKATDVCQKCGACRVEQGLRDLLVAPGLTLYAHTEVVDSRSENGLLHLTLKSAPQPIDSGVELGMPQASGPDRSPRTARPKRPNR